MTRSRVVSRLLLVLLAPAVLAWLARTLQLAGVFASLEPHFEGRFLDCALP